MQGALPRPSASPGFSGPKDRGVLCCVGTGLRVWRMKQVPKPTTDEALIQEFLNKGGKVSKGKTKPLAAELGLSNNVWNNKLTRDEKAARDKS